MIKNIVFLLVCLSLAGCESTVKWQEEVKLSTGEIITIDREVRHEGGGAAWPQGQGSVPMEQIIRFRYPAQTGPLIEWRSTKLGPAGTYAELPLVLDLGVDKTWFIFTLHWPNEGCVQYVKYQFQNGAWAETLLREQQALLDQSNRDVTYQLRNGVWVKTPLREQQALLDQSYQALKLLTDDIETYPTNLFLAADSNEIEGLISLAEKTKENSSMGYPKHLRKVGPKRGWCRPNDNF